MFNTVKSVSSSSSRVPPAGFYLGYAPIPFNLVVGGRNSQTTTQYLKDGGMGVMTPSSYSDSSSISTRSSNSYKLSTPRDVDVDCNLGRRHGRCIKVAIDEARKSNILHKHGCVLVSGGKIISKGHNTNRTASKDGLIRNCCSCHAEIAAIRNFAKSEGLRGHYKQWVQPGKCKENYAKSNNLYCETIK